MKRFFYPSAVLFFIVLSGSLSAQQLYMPRNIKIAYANGTRSLEGPPGKNYWQNEGKYDISETITPATKLVSGQENIVYSNNSPDTLDVLVIRFVNNVHKPTSPRGSQMSEDFFTTGLDITSFSVNGETYNVNSKNWGTVGVVRLKQPLMPHTSATVNIGWNYPLSKQDGREGQIDSTTFYVAYSYPRISVYDDYNGWDVLPHTLGQEFYNDFNDYQLSIKAPKNFVVWATGDLQNPDEVLQPTFAKRLKDSYTSDKVIHIANLKEMKSGKVTKQNDWNTWKFSADHITDVCYAVSDHYVWDGASVEVDPATHRRSSVQAAYNDTAADFHHSVEWAQNSLRFFSTQWPGVPYPFPKMTAFQGHADMEYPMMVNDATVTGNGRFGNAGFKFAQMVQDHEIAHTYFPFYMGINEKRYAFMDEGWATTYEYLIGLEENGKGYTDSTYKRFRIERYISDPSTDEDQPIITMSNQESGAGYGNNSYGKASLSYLALKDYLGDSTFKKALHFYMNAWHGKHPIPWDYFNCMSTGSGKDLNWFFRNWFFTNNYIDLKIDTLKKQGNDYTLNVTNVGGFAIPFDVKITYADGQTATMHETPAVWENNEHEQVFKIPGDKIIKSVALDGGIFMDYTPEDNVWQQ
ncbi:MAG TPA: M1 family metallopeptidase [Hanamia sp.]|nr:M1 family metallopeptidase [Hanamia sp.]